MLPSTRSGVNRMLGWVDTAESQDAILGELTDRSESSSVRATDLEHPATRRNQCRKVLVPGVGSTCLRVNWITLKVAIRLSVKEYPSLMMFGGHVILSLTQGGRSRGMCSPSG